MKPSDRFVWNLEKRKWPPGSSRTAATAAGRTRTPKAARTHCRTACGSGGHCPVGRRKGRAAVALPVPTRFAIRPGPHSDERRKELVNKFVIQRGGRERSGDVRVHPCRSPPPGDSEKLRKYDHQDVEDDVGHGHRVLSPRSVLRAEGHKDMLVDPAKPSQPQPRSARPTSHHTNLLGQSPATAGSAQASAPPGQSPPAFRLPELCLAPGGRVTALAKVAEAPEGRDDLKAVAV